MSSSHNVLSALCTTPQQNFSVTTTMPVSLRSLTVFCTLTAPPQFSRRSSQGMRAARTTKTCPKRHHFKCKVCVQRNKMKEMLSPRLVDSSTPGLATPELHYSPWKKLLPEEYGRVMDGTSTRRVGMIRILIFRFLAMAFHPLSLAAK